MMTDATRSHPPGEDTRVFPGDSFNRLQAGNQRFEDMDEVGRITRHRFRYGTETDADMDLVRGLTNNRFEEGRETDNDITLISTLVGPETHAVDLEYDPSLESKVHATLKDGGDVVDLLQHIPHEFASAISSVEEAESLIQSLHRAESVTSAADRIVLGTCSRTNQPQIFEQIMRAVKAGLQIERTQVEISIIHTQDGSGRQGDPQSSENRSDMYLEPVYEAGRFDELPPILVYIMQDGTLHLADGSARLLCARKHNLSTIDAYLIPYTPKRTEQIIAKLRAPRIRPERDD